MDSLFRINHTDPWVGGDAHRTSRTINFQNTRTSGNAIHGRAQDEVDRAADGGPAAADAEDPAGDGNVIVARLTGGVEYARPLATGVRYSVPTQRHDSLHMSAIEILSLLG